MLYICNNSIRHQSFVYTQRNGQILRFLTIQFSISHLFIIFTNPSARAGYDTRSIFKRSLTGLNSEFSFSLTSSLTKAEETSLSCYLPIAGGIIIGFIPFPRVLVQCEMPSVSSRIWTRVTVSISYNDNHYTTGTSNELFVYVQGKSQTVQLDPEWT